MVARRSFDAAEAARVGSLVHLMVRYLADLRQKNFSPRTVQTKERQLRQFAEWCAERAAHDAVHVTRPVIERYQRWLFHQRRPDGLPLSVSYQVHRVRALQALFRWAVRQHIVPANPAADLDHPRPVKRLPLTLSPAQIEAVLAEPDVATPLGLRDRAVMELLYATGIRRMEAAHLRLEDVDIAQGVVRVHQGKGFKDRIVPVGGRALHWHRRWIEEGRGAFAPPEERAVYVSRRGRPLAPGDLTPLVRRYVRAVGVAEHGSCHLFRHTMATALHNAGCDVRVIQAILGHEKLGTTALYTQVGIEHLQAAHAAFHPAAELPAVYGDATDTSAADATEADDADA